MVCELLPERLKKEKRSWKWEEENICNYQRLISITYKELPLQTGPQNWPTANRREQKMDREYKQAFCRKPKHPKDACVTTPSLERAEIHKLRQPRDRVSTHPLAGGKRLTLNADKHGDKSIQSETGHSPPVNNNVAVPLSGPNDSSPS